ncbi:MAG: aldo/keto reductase [Phycisphaerae bacterium]|jgi:predicted aldo/keto reductase-like oxidoreductase|nr:aldo/keto reductase [Phycisphaerae bacterium]
MAPSEPTRRDFLRATSAAAVVGAAASIASAKKSEKKQKILNYNPKMGYRRLGKTDLMISEVSLGGHGGRKPEDRVPVLDKAVELGVNFVDTNMASEVALYGKAMAKAKIGKREKFYIGFGDWPVKVTSEYEKNLTEKLLTSEIDKRLKAYNTDMLDLWRPVGATWGKGQKKIATMLTVSKKTLDLVANVFEKVRKAGKVRFLGISAHNPKVFRRVLEEYPQFSVVIFPYLFLTKEFGGDSLLKLATDKDVGVIGLKPFGAGTTFGLKPREIKGRVDKRAHVLVREMLTEKRLSAIIPGVNIPEQLEENVKGSYERGKTATKADKTAIRECTENYYAHITPEYKWLHQWETV